MRIMIEEDGKGGVNVTTDEEEVSVKDAYFLIELAKMSLMSYYLGGEEYATLSDDEQDSPLE